METLLTAVLTVTELLPLAQWDGHRHGGWIVFAPLFWLAIIVGFGLLVRSRGGGPAYAEASWASRITASGVRYSKRSAEHCDAL